MEMVKSLSGNRLGRVEGTEDVEFGEKGVQGWKDIRSLWKMCRTCHVKKANMYSMANG